MYIVPYSHHPGLGEEYKVVKRGRKYHGCGEEHNVEIRERRSYTIYPILRLLGRISNGESVFEVNDDVVFVRGYYRVTS